MYLFVLYKDESQEFAEDVDVNLPETHQQFPLRIHPLYFLGKRGIFSFLFYFSIDMFIQMTDEYETVKTRKLKLQCGRITLRKGKRDGVILSTCKVAICMICTRKCEVTYSAGTSNLNAYIRVHHPAAQGCMELRVLILLFTHQNLIPMLQSNINPQNLITFNSLFIKISECMYLQYIPIYRNIQSMILQCIAKWFYLAIPNSSHVVYIILLA